MAVRRVSKRFGPTSTRRNSSPVIVEARGDEFTPHSDSMLERPLSWRIAKKDLIYSACQVALIA